MAVSEKMKDELYAQYHMKVRNYIWGKVGDAHLAEDLCSEVFLKVYENLNAFDPSKASISTWIYTIARNRLTDYYRSRRVLEEIPETLSDESSVETEICSREALDALADALEKIDAREREIIILRYYSGKTLREIAERMRLSYTHIKTLHRHALSALRNLMGAK